MSNADLPEARWNRFARELGNILQAHRLSWSYLANYLGIHLEKIRRLKLPNTFHLLNPEEVDRITQQLQFSEQEKQQLQAAILATAIEETLANRITMDDSHQAADEVYKIILKALKDGNGPLSVTRGKAMAHNNESTSDLALDTLLEPALEYLDRALIALHLLSQANSKAERSDQALLAIDNFLRAQQLMAALAENNPSITNQRAWLFWNEETKQGITKGKELISSLE